MGQYKSLKNQEGHLMMILLCIGLGESRDDIREKQTTVGLWIIISGERRKHQQGQAHPVALFHFFYLRWSERASEWVLEWHTTTTTTTIISLLLCIIMHRRIVQNRIRWHAHSSVEMQLTGWGYCRVIYNVIFILILTAVQWAMGSSGEMGAFIIWFITGRTVNGMISHSTAQQ